MVAGKVFVGRAVPQPEVKMQVRGICAAADIVAAVVGIVVAMAAVVGVGVVCGIVDGVIAGLLPLPLLAPGCLRLRRPRVLVARLLEERLAFRRRRRNLLPFSYIHLLGG